MLFEGFSTSIAAALAVLFCWVGIRMTVSNGRLRRAGRISPAQVLVGLTKAGAWAAIGIVSMHYLGMYAMYFQNGTRMVYNYWLVLLSSILGFLAASAAFGIFHYAHYASEFALAALVLGLGVCSVHYTGMAAVTYLEPEAGFRPDVILNGLNSMEMAFIVASLSLLLGFFAMAFLSVKQSQLSKMLEALVRERTTDVQIQKERADGLLYSLLPRHIADVLKKGGHPPNRSYDNAAILFADIVGFTRLSATISADELVHLLNQSYAVEDALNE